MVLLSLVVVCYTHRQAPPAELVLSGLPDGSSDLPLTGNLSGAALVFSLVCILGPKTTNSEKDGRMYEMTINHRAS